MQTSKLQEIVEGLDPCEKYLFTVGVVGPLGTGLRYSHPVMVQTNASLIAPPKDIRIQKDLQNDTIMNVEWSPSCPGIEVAYIVSNF